MFGPVSTSHSLWKKHLHRSFFRIAFAQVLFSSTWSATSIRAQQINPYAEEQPVATRLPSVDSPRRSQHQSLGTVTPATASFETFLHAPAKANDQPSRLPLTLPPPIESAPPVIPGPTSESRFEPIQVRTPTWLPAATPLTKQLEGRRWLNQAHHEYSVSAYASAEASAWSALRHFAEAVDGPVLQTTSQTGVTEPLTATQCLTIAETALDEAKDFAGKYGPLDVDAIKRFVRCHQTKVIRLDDHEDTALTSSSEAVDRYMNEARVHLGPIAATSVDAAEAMDLLAEIAMGRYDADALPNEVALTLWRAVAQGQPMNAMVASTLGKHLARVGLHDEARWALEHSLSISFDEETALALAETSRKVGDTQTAMQLNDKIVQQHKSDFVKRPSVPEVIRLTPEQFAALSQPVMLQNSTPEKHSTAGPPQAPKSNRVSAKLASARLSPTENNPEVEIQPNETLVMKPADSTQPSFWNGIMKRIGGSK